MACRPLIIDGVDIHIIACRAHALNTADANDWGGASPCSACCVQQPREQEDKCHVTMYKVCTFSSRVLSKELMEFKGLWHECDFM